MNQGARPEAEIREIAESCLALLKVQGKPIEAILAEIGLDAGGWLRPEEVAAVRRQIAAII